MNDPTTPAWTTETEPATVMFPLEVPLLDPDEFDVLGAHTSIADWVKAVFADPIARSYAVALITAYWNEFPQMVFRPQHRASVAWRNAMRDLGYVVTKDRSAKETGP
jgi:hypothetical protein